MKNKRTMWMKNKKDFSGLKTKRTIVDEKQKDYSGLKIKGLQWKKNKKNKETQSKFTSKFLMMKTHDFTFFVSYFKRFF